MIKMDSRVVSVSASNHPNERGTVAYVTGQRVVVAFDSNPKAFVKMRYDEVVEVSQ